MWTTTIWILTTVLGQIRCTRNRNIIHAVFTFNACKRMMQMRARVGSGSPWIAGWIVRKTSATLSRSPLCRRNLRAVKNPQFLAESSGRPPSISWRRLDPPSHFVVELQHTSLLSMNLGKPQDCFLLVLSCSHCDNFSHTPLRRVTACCSGRRCEASSWGTGIFWYSQEDYQLGLRIKQHTWNGQELSSHVDCSYALADSTDVLQHLLNFWIVWNAGKVVQQILSAEIISTTFLTRAPTKYSFSTLYFCTLMFQNSILCLSKKGLFLSSPLQRNRARQNVQDSFVRLRSIFLELSVFIPCWIE